mgnify:CR=1 FL=1
MSKISEYLNKIKTAIYGREVRDAIHDSIKECYADVTSGATLANEASDKANAATEKANTAASNADTATASANSAANLANTAASNADNKAALADEATANANAATESANAAASSAADKAALANTAATGATAAMNSANEAASNANSKATLADEATANANAATESANTAASNADNKAALADKATTDANNAANQANTAATTADDKAALADNAAGLIRRMDVSTTHLPPGSAPTSSLNTVEDASGLSHYSLVLGIPTGNTGATPALTFEVSTGEAGTNATVEVTGTAEAPIVHLTIPKGDTGKIENLVINGKPVDNGTITLTASDVGALSGTDSTLAIAGEAADAQKVGTELNQLKTEIKKKYSMEVLWENAAPNSAFEEQTVTFDWKGYNYCMIYFLAYVNSNVRSFSAVAKKGDRLRFYFLTDTDHGAGGQFRDFTLDTNHFGKAIRLTDSTSDDQRACIPVRIYGVKGV